jgi:hypothetical protein
MNRAWIPAVALAGVSVAGLLALGPLTDSMGTPVSFPTTVPTETSTPSHFVPVSINISRGVVGQVSIKTKTTPRGGPATTTATASNPDTGLVGYRKPSVRKATVTTTLTHSAAKPKVVKKTVKRQGSIGGSGETNSNAGLASGSSSTQRNVGEQQATLPGDGN